MTKVKEIYKCNICGNTVEVLVSGQGTLVCCGENMELLKEVNGQETEEQDVEIAAKHIPIIEQKDNKIIVTVGKVEHPMTKEHHIKWIEVNIDGSIYVKKLNIGEKPIAEFKGTGNKVSARAYCNKHGLWKS